MKAIKIEVVNGSVRALITYDETGGDEGMFWWLETTDGNMITRHSSLMGAFEALAIYIGKTEF